jgi:hypothetical protein
MAVKTKEMLSHFFLDSTMVYLHLANAANGISSPAKSSKSLSAYAVIFSIRCLSIFLVTGSPQRPQTPPAASSLTSTALHLGRPTTWGGALDAPEESCTRSAHTISNAQTCAPLPDG